MRQIHWRIIRFVYGAAVFIAALFISGHFMTNTVRATAETLPQSTLPVLTMEAEGLQFNELHGFTQERDLTRFRAPLTPLGSDRTVMIAADPGSSQVTGLTCEVRTLSGSRLLEKTDVPVPAAGSDGTLHFSFALKDLIESDREYILTLVLSLEEGQEVRYYTRVLCSEDNDAPAAASVPETSAQTETGGQTESDSAVGNGEDAAGADAAGTNEETDRLPLYLQAVSFVQEFHEKCLEGTDTSYLGNYIEPEGESDSLALVDIHSSLEQVGFNGLAPSEIVAPVYTLTSQEDGAFLLDGSYVVEAADPFHDNSTARFLCQEYYRINKGFDRFHLISFRRTMVQLIDLRNCPFEEDLLQLGVADPDLQLEKSADGRTLAFVMNGALYSVDAETSTAAVVSAFAAADSTDRRDLYPSHNVRILSVEEDGSICFLLYGYMNRGSHEGDVGVSACRYDAAAHTVEELAYLSYAGSSELLASQIETGVYLNDGGVLYLLLDDRLYRIDTKNHTIRLADAVPRRGEIVSSEDGRMTAWVERDSGAVVFTDLTDFSQQRIEPEEGEVITPIGFLNEDLIIGRARTADLTTDVSGMGLTPMYCLQILDHSLQVLEDYQEEPYYITEAVIQDNQLTLHRVEKTEAGYIEAADDQIVSAAGGSGQGTAPAAITNGSYNRALTLSVGGFDPENFRYVTAKALVFRTSRDLTEAMQELDQEETSSGEEEQHQWYDVYGLYGYERSCTSAADAVRQAASEGAGASVLTSGSYAWKPVTESRCQLDDVGSTETQAAVRSGSSTAAAACLNAMIQYAGGSAGELSALPEGTAADVFLQQSLENAAVLTLTGCTMENVLYYPAAGSPVMAATADGAVLIIGFGPRNIAVWDPSGIETVTFWSRSRAQQEFQAAGNRFLTYIVTE